MDGVVRRHYRFPHITYPYSTCISSFWQQHPYFFVLFENVFSFLIIYTVVEVRPVVAIYTFIRSYY